MNTGLTLVEMIALVSVVIALIGLLWKIHASTEKADRELHGRITKELAREREDRHEAVSGLHNSLHGYVHKDVLMELVSNQMRSHGEQLTNLREIFGLRFEQLNEKVDEMRGDRREKRSVTNPR